MPITSDTSFVDSLAPNVAVQFLDRVAKSPDAEAYRFPRGRPLEVGHLEAGRRPRSGASPPACSRWASSPSSGSASSSNTRYEWILADLAVMCAAGATTTVYPSTNAEDTAYILSDSECRVVFAEDDDQIAKVTRARPSCPHVTKVVTFDGAADGDWVISLDDLAELGDAYLAEHPDVIEETAKAITPDQLATLIYTSGTTGRPKGVRLRHRVLGLRGRGHPRPRTSSARTTCSSCGCRWPTRSARC